MRYPTWKAFSPVIPGRLTPWVAFFVSIRESIRTDLRGRVEKAGLSHPSIYRQRPSVYLSESKRQQWGSIFTEALRSFVRESCMYAPQWGVHPIGINFV
jgi:hypothetical protein